jgi:hypothetical protein
LRPRRCLPTKMPSVRTPSIMRPDPNSC